MASHGLVQVAERTLFLWNNEYIVNLIAQHRTSVLPTVFPALELNARSHWNPAVHGLTCNVRKMFQEMDPALYEECRRHFEDDQVRACTMTFCTTTACAWLVGWESLQVSYRQGVNDK